MKNTRPGCLAAAEKVPCNHCSKLVSRSNILRHEATCWSNAVNQKACPVCGKMFAGKNQTCSHACANTKFRSGVDNPNWKGDSYRHICFDAHGKKCLVCGEEKVVAAHHVNENHNDDRPENLVPLCPTHHQYMHSKYRNEVEPIIVEYLNQFQGIV